MDESGFYIFGGTKIHKFISPRRWWHWVDELGPFGLVSNLVNVAVLTAAGLDWAGPAIPAGLDSSEPTRACGGSFGVIARGCSGL